ncbi:MAG: hypothetical protein PHP00_11375 [Thiotrichaceae bacterium]|nr:hypothetical protein [Thiotrichaceae bacterium]
MEIKINTVGRIIASNQKQDIGKFIKVEPSSESGDFLILKYTENGGFDDWVRNKEDLEYYFEEEELLVEWL